MAFVVVHVLLLWFCWWCCVVGGVLLYCEDGSGVAKKKNSALENFHYLSG